MSVREPKDPVINLDEEPFTRATLIVSVDGQRVLLSRARVLELLRREGELTQLLAGARPADGAKDSATAEGENAAPASRGYVPPPEGAGLISHATLSYRVKRIHDFGARQRRLRETHGAILHDLLQSFDGRIPEHPSRALEQNLTSMLRWRSVPPDLKEAIQRFLSGYLEAKARRRG